MGLTTTLPLIALASGCLLLGLAAPVVISQLSATIAVVTRLPEPVVASALPEATGPLTGVSTVSILLLGVVVLLVVIRKMLLAGREVTTAVTWDCGYARPAASMQYTGSSFSEPATAVLGDWAGYRRDVPNQMPYFPADLVVGSASVDPAEAVTYRPLFALIRETLAWGRVLHSGRVHVYVLYITLTLLGLIVWVLGGDG